MTAKKWSIYLIGAFLLYSFFIYLYLYYFSTSQIPLQFKGTVADPQTFLSAQEYILSIEYSRLRNLIYFLTTPFEGLVYLLILITGLSTLFNKWAQQTTKFNNGQHVIYLFWFTLLTTLIFFPINYFQYYLSKQFGITTQNFRLWMKDEVLELWINFGLTIIVVVVLYYLIRKTRHWWFFAWLLSIPFTLMLVFIQPVVIDPLYDDFYRLQNKQLEEKILSLASKANIPAEHVYEVNKSAKTNALNAYVTGIGSNARIVLWDTTLERMSEDEVLFIMAHEMAHYTKKHIYVGIATYFALSLVGLYLINKLMAATIAKYGRRLQIKTIKEIRSLPLLLLFTAMLLFLSSPITNYISRHQELSADRYAIELTENNTAAISAYQKLAKASLNDVNPPLLVKLFRYTHPTILERINNAQQ